LPGPAAPDSLGSVDSLLGIPAGLALSTAAGLRVFVPLLLTSAAARFGYITLAPGMTWIGSDAALVAFATATVLDARRASAVTLALGATPQQVRAGLVMAQVIPALPGAILGLPLGIGLFKVTGHGLSGLPPVLWLVAAGLGTVLVIAALTSIPARIGLRRPVAEMLQTEAT